MNPHSISLPSARWTEPKVMLPVAAGLKGPRRPSEETAEGLSQPAPPLALGGSTGWWLRATALLALLLWVAGRVTAAPEPVLITSHPRAQTCVWGGRAVFSVVARGTAPLGYQWCKDGSLLAGATNDALILTNLQFSDAGQYAVTVSNAAGSVTSSNAALVVNAPQGGDVDFSFDFSCTINWSVYAVAVQPDGKVLIAGGFTSVHGAVRRRVARLNADGSTDHTFLNGLSGANGTVYCLAVQADGKVLIGGAFTGVNGLRRDRIARLNPDGSLDETFLNGLSGANGSVLCLAVQADGKVLVGGDFTTVNGVSRNRIARLNPDGSLDETFLDGLSGASGTVQCLAVQADGKVLIGGDFTIVNGTTRNRLAQLNPDGSLDESFLHGLSGANGTVYCLAVQADGKVLIGGSFSTVNGVSRWAFARLSPDGSLDETFLNGLSGAQATVFCLGVQADGNVLIGGFFTTVNGVSRNRIARLNPDGSLDETFLNGLSGADDTVFCLAVQADGKLLIGGGFSYVNGVSRKRIARLNPDGSLDETFLNGLSGANGYVLCLAVQADGKVLIGGDFTTVNGVSRNRIARLKPDGSLDESFLHGLSGANGSVDCLAVQADGKVLIGGSFATVNGVSRNRIARLNPDGSLDETFLNGLSGANGWVHCLAVQADGKVLIGGSFTLVNGEPRSYVARLWGSSVPTILTQPQSQTVPLGTNVALSVTASGQPPLSYQWCKEGAPLAENGRISGATTATLTISNVQLTDPGSYQVVVSNLFGSVTSAVARVCVRVELRVEPGPGWAWPAFRFPEIGAPVCEWAVEWSESLVPGIWQVLYTSRDLAAPVVLPIESGQPRRFYRLVLRPCNP